MVKSLLTRLLTAPINVVMADIKQNELYKILVYDCDFRKSKILKSHKQNCACSPIKENN